MRKHAFPTCLILLILSNPAFSEQYVHNTIRKPIMDLLMLDVPEVLGNQELAGLGFVDVTAQPFNADATGKTDSTKALQKAINFARDHQMVCFFPCGTYKVSDTLSCIQGYYRRQHGRILGAPNFPCVLVGSREDNKPRPKILLAPHTPGFGNPLQPKYVVHFWARKIGEPHSPQPNICFGQMFINIDITIGEGNPGAIGIRLRGAQGSGIQDCTIDVTDGLAGLEGGAGSGGSHAGITIIGGKIGMDLCETQPAPTITGITLINQRETAILYGGRQALSAVGIKIVSKSNGPVIKVAPQWNVHFQGPLVLVDSEIIFDNSDTNNVLLFATRSFYLSNVYAKRAATIAALPEGTGLTGNPEGWLRIKEYAQQIKPKPYKGLQYKNSIYINGRRQQRPYARTEHGKAPPKDIQKRHLWPTNFPTWQSKRAVNVKLPPYNAKADGITDDTAALQRAITENEIIFLPKGLYRVTKTIKLRPHTKIVGTGKTFSVIVIRGDEGYFTDNANPKPVVETANTKDGDCLMAFCGIYVPFEVPGAYALKWSCGRNSICRDLDFMLMPFVGYGVRIPEHDPRTTPFVQITDNGGGKWFNFELGKGIEHSGYRQILVKDTSEPLSFYQCCPEGTRSEANMEIKNAKNVTLYGLKGEGNTYMLWIKDSDQIKVYGYGGNASGSENSTLFKIENTPNFLMANIVDHPFPKGKKAIRGAVGTDPEKYYMIIEETADGSTVKTAPLDRPVLYKRGSPKIPD